MKCVPVRPVSQVNSFTRKKKIHQARGCSVQRGGRWARGGCTGDAVARDSTATCCPVRIVYGYRCEVEAIVPVFLLSDAARGSAGKSCP